MSCFSCSSTTTPTATRRVFTQRQGERTTNEEVVDAAARRAQQGERTGNEEVVDAAAAHVDGGAEQLGADVVVVGLAQIKLVRAVRGVQRHDGLVAQLAAEGDLGGTWQTPHEVWHLAAVEDARPEHLHDGHLHGTA